MKTFPFLAALLGICSLAVPGRASDAEWRRGDAHDTRYQPKQALEYYLPAVKEEPNNPELLLRVARQYRHLMADTSNKEEKLKLGRTSLEYAERAAKAAPGNSEAQLSPAISLGKMTTLLPQKEQVAASPRIRSSALAAIARDSQNDLAWHILGRWNRVLAEVSGFKRAIAGVVYGSLPKGSFEEAERCLKKAVAINPRRLMHHIELGRIYAAQGKKEEARESLNKGLAMPAVEKDDADMKALGREALKTVQ